MAFVENISQFFSDDDFAVEAVITLSNNQTKTVNVIFNPQTIDAHLLESEVVSDNPNFIAATVDIADVRKNHYVLVEGVNRKIEKITHDGTGMSTVYLSK